MRVIRKGNDEPFDDLFPGTYEFKLCGGCVTPDDLVGSNSVDGAGEESGAGDGDAAEEEGD